MIYIAPNRSLDFDGVAADAVNDLITYHKDDGRAPDTIKLALSIHNCVGARVTFTSGHWLYHFKHLFGEWFERKGINLSAPATGIKPARYDDIYKEEVLREKARLK